MAGAEDTSDLDLSGSWQGLFSYPSERGREPVAFSAEITESTGWLDGEAQEEATAGAVVGQIISASLRGRRSERSVSFLKLYDGAHRGYDTVCYEGEVSVDGNEIDGHWTIPGSWSGRFLMIRSGEVATAVAAEETQRV